METSAKFQEAVERLAALPEKPEDIHTVILAETEGPYYIYSPTDCPIGKYLAKILGVGVNTGEFGLSWTDLYYGSQSSPLPGKVRVFLEYAKNQPEFNANLTHR